VKRISVFLNIGLPEKSHNQADYNRYAKFHDLKTRDCEMTLPTIGAKGCITVAAPFDTLINPSRIYQVYSIRLLPDMKISGENPYEEIYQPVGVPESVFKQHLDEGKSIITFIGDGNEVLHIPEPYVLSYPVVSGVRYQSKALAIDIGPLPVDYDLSALVNEVAQVIHDRIGITPGIEVVLNSAVMKVPYDDHEQILTMRQNAITVRKSWKQRYIELQNVMALDQTVMDSMECLLLNGCCGHDCDSPGGPSIVQDETVELCYTDCAIDGDDLFYDKHVRGETMDPGPIWNPTIPEDIFPEDPELFLSEVGPCGEGDAASIFYKNLT